MNLETRVALNRFKPRWYQERVIDAVENKGYKKLLIILARRAGKDIVCWNIAIRQCLKETCTVYYMLPTLSQARKVIWQSITNDGKKFLDFIPKETIKSTHEQDMRVVFHNGSQLLLAGSDNYERLVGTNPKMIIWSEWALADPESYWALRPVLLGNGGYALFCSTPRGKNHMFAMYNVATSSKDWFVMRLGVDDTKHISLYEIEKERADGLITEDKIQQEYHVSFIRGHEGAIYCNYLDKSRLEGRITTIPYELSSLVYTCWDIGRDCTSIIFFQVIGGCINIIDYYQKSNENLDHFVRIIEGKQYRYGTHFFPHDIRVTSWDGPKITRLDKVRAYGLQAKDLQKLPLADGIEHARANFHKVWFNEATTKQLLDGLENYRWEYDTKKNIYSAAPVHDMFSHPADAFRYMMQALKHVTTKDSTPEEIELRYRKAVYGSNHDLPHVFRNDHTLR